MSIGKLYGVGVGPGDKELLTLKALRLIKEADVIAVPLMKSGARTAYEIIKEYTEDKEIAEYLMPMTRDIAALEENYDAIADSVETYLRAGKNVAFITLGDVTVYSTYMQIDRRIRERGFNTELVPGVTSFSAAAARLGTALCERNEPLTVIPAGCPETEALLGLSGTRVLMKAGGRLGDVRDMLKTMGLAEKAVMVECCGMENERIYEDISEADGNASYFSIIIVKE